MKAKLYLLAIAAVILPSAAQAASIEGTAVIVDGDTLDINDTRIRLHGIDAPEAGQKCVMETGSEWRCGQSATKALTKLVDGKTVKCSNLADDGMGRFVASCQSGGLDISAAMISSGLAWAFIKYSTDYVSQEADARKAHIGIWKGRAQPAWEYRAERWTVELQAAPRNCPIKGNISKNGRIYHAPWSKDYSKTKVSKEKGERWFCSEAEAVSAGFRAPRWNLDIH